MSQEARDVWAWVLSTNTRPGDGIPLKPFTLWCLNQSVTPMHYKSALDELCQLGRLKKRSADEWDYFRA
ncbi:hypothetical protein WAB73_003202 [Salmonella enterica subsp. enterica]|nr:hypothetical protein [Salmonella enterica subsp. enterica serovar Colindale]